MLIIEDSKKSTLANEKDLQTIKHDEILQWLYRNVTGLIGGNGTNQWDDDFVNSVLQNAFAEIGDVVRQLTEGLEKFGKFKRDYDNPSVPNDRQELEWLKKQLTFYNQYANNFALLVKDLGQIPNFPGVIAEQKQLQFPIYDFSSKNRQLQNPKIVGFTDLKAKIRFPKLFVSGIHSGFHKDTSKWVQPDLRFVVSFHTEPQTWYFDVRAEISNLGSLIREIKLTKDSLKAEDSFGYTSSNFNDHYAVVGNLSETAMEILNEQDVPTFNYDPKIEYDPKDLPSKDLLPGLDEFEVDDDYEILPFAYEEI